MIIKSIFFNLLSWYSIYFFFKHIFMLYFKSCRILLQLQAGWQAIITWEFYKKALFCIQSWQESPAETVIGIFVFPLNWEQSESKSITDPFNNTHGWIMQRINRLPSPCLLPKPPCQTENSKIWRAHSYQPMVFLPSVTSWQRKSFNFLSSLAAEI